MTNYEMCQATAPVFFSTQYCKLFIHKANSYDYVYCSFMSVKLTEMRTVWLSVKPTGQKLQGSSIWKACYQILFSNQEQDIKFAQ